MAAGVIVGAGATITDGVAVITMAGAITIGE